MSQGKEFPDFSPEGEAAHIDDSSGSGSGCDDDDDDNNKDEEESAEEAMSEGGSESEDDNIVCYGSGEEDSDEVTEDLEPEEEGSVSSVRWSGTAQDTTTTATTTSSPTGPPPTREGGEVKKDSNDDKSKGDDCTVSTSPGMDAPLAVDCMGPAPQTGKDNSNCTRIQDLDKERAVLVKATEKEEQQRLWFYRQLENITSKLSTLPLTYTYDLQTDMTRRQLEQEAKQVQEEMTNKLGGTKQSSLRQEARLRRIRAIEAEIMMLEQQGPPTNNPPTEDSKENPAVEVTKATGTEEQTTVPKPTDTVTVTSAGGQGRMAPGMPVNSYVSNSMRDAAWPFHKDASHRLNRVVSGEFDGLTSLTSSTTSIKSSPSQSSFPTSATEHQSPYFSKKVNMVYSLLSMLNTQDKEDMSRTLLAMSSSRDSCITMRQSGCLPLLIQLLHGSDKDSDLLGNTRGSVAARARASAALHNIVHCNPDDKRARRESRTLRLLEQIRAHCDQQRGETTEDAEDGLGVKSDIDHHPGPAIAALMKLSFDEDHRHAICTLGGLQAMAELLEVDNTLHGNTSDAYSVTIRRYACMALTNLTFGDGKNKALLCSMHAALQALVAQLESSSEDLCQGAASVLRNLSWRADLASKKTLREVGAVTSLMQSAMRVKKETTLKSILSALWNLSSHSTENKAQICAVEGALQFLVSLLTYKSAGKTDAIVENGGGILRNVSSLVAVREDYRSVLRQKGCLQLLLAQLRSPSLTIVSNACGTLWNLSARCLQDQDTLREMGAIGMLRNLVHSKHRMISMGSSAALRNLLASAGPGKGIDCSFSNDNSRPTLSARKQRALKEELEAQNLSETCENVESPQDSPTTTPTRPEDNRRFVYPFDLLSRSEEDPRRVLHRRQVSSRSSSSESSDGRMRSPLHMPRARSHDSVFGHRSDISLDRSRVQNMLAKTSHLLQRRQGRSLERPKNSASRLRLVQSDLAYCSRDGYEKSADSLTQSEPPGHIVSATQEVVMLADGIGEDAGASSVSSGDHTDSSEGRGGLGQANASQMQTGAVQPASFQTTLRHPLTKKNITINPGYQKEDDSDSCGETESLNYQQSAYTLYSSPAALGTAPHSVSPAQVRAGAVNPYHGLRLGFPEMLVRMPNPQPQNHPFRVANGFFPGALECGPGQPSYRAPPNMMHLRFPPPHSFPAPPPAHQLQAGHTPQLWLPGHAPQNGGVTFGSGVDSHTNKTPPFCRPYAAHKEAWENGSQGRPVMLQSIEESDQEGMSTSMIEHDTKEGVNFVAEEAKTGSSKTEEIREEEEGRGGGEEEEAGGGEEEDSRSDELPPPPEEFLSHIRAFSASNNNADSQSHPTLVLVPTHQDDLPGHPWRPSEEMRSASPCQLQCPSFSTFKPAAAGVTGMSPSSPSPTKLSQSMGKIDWQRGLDNGQVDDKTAELLNSFSSAVLPPHPITPSDGDPLPPVPLDIGGLTEETVTEEGASADTITASAADSLPEVLDAAADSLPEVLDAAADSLPEVLDLSMAGKPTVSREEKQDSEIIIDSDLVKEEEEEESSVSEVSEDEEDMSLDQCIISEGSGKVDVSSPEVDAHKAGGGSSEQTVRAYRSQLPVKVTPMSSISAAASDIGKDASVNAADLSSSPPDGVRPSGKIENLPRLKHSKIPLNQTIPHQYVLPQRVSSSDCEADTQENRMNDNRFGCDTATSSQNARNECHSLEKSRPKQTDQHQPHNMPYSRLPRKLSAGRNQSQSRTTLLSNGGKSSHDSAHQTSHTSSTRTEELPFSQSEASTCAVFTPETSPNKFSASPAMASHFNVGVENGSSAGRLSKGRGLITPSKECEEIKVHTSAPCHSAATAAGKKAGNPSSILGENPSELCSSVSQRAVFYLSDREDNDEEMEEPGSQLTDFNAETNHKITSRLPVSVARSAAGSGVGQYRGREQEGEKPVGISSPGFYSEQSTEHAYWNETAASDHAEAGVSHSQRHTLKSERLPSPEEPGRAHGAEATNNSGEEAVLRAEHREDRRASGRSMMTRSHSDIVETSDDGKPLQFSTWQRQRELSSEELASHQKKEGCVRSQSQDNFLKTHKNICNRIVQSTVENSPSGGSAATSHYIQSCATSLIPVPASSSDNRLTEHHHLISGGCAAAHGDTGGRLSVADSSNSWEKADSEKSISDDLYLHKHLKRKSAEDNSDYADDNEEDEEESDFDEEETHTLEETEDGGKRTVVGKDSFDKEDLSFAQDTFGEDLLEDDVISERRLTSCDHQKIERCHAALEHEMSAEDELLLLENANLIVSEIVTKRDMSGSSTIEEDILIENETLSLVSNDYTSDTESEVSVCWSVHSDKQNEQVYSQEELVTRGRARVVKPSEVPVQKTAKQPESKAIRGRRKPLYSKPTPSASFRTATKGDVNKSQAAGGRGVTSSTGGGAIGARTVRGQAGKLPPAAGGTGRGSSLPRTPAHQQARSGIPGLRASSQGNQRSGTTALKGSSLPKAQTASLTRSASGSAIPKSATRGASSTPPSRLPSSAGRSKGSVERPKPPAKQSTFVKEPATPTNEDKDVTSAIEGGGKTQSATGKQSLSEKEKKGLPQSQTGSADKSAANTDGKKGQTELSAAQKPNTKDNASASKTTTGSKLQRPSNIGRVTPISSPTKLGADGKSAGTTLSSPSSSKGSTRSNLPTRTGLNKSGSTTSLRKTGPGVGMTKANSGSSLSKDCTGIQKLRNSPNKGDIKKSESSASLRRGSNVSSPSSPKVIRRSSVSTPSRHLERTSSEERKKTTGQRQLPRAGLRKEKSPVGRSLSLEETGSTTSPFKPRSKSSSLPTSARNMCISSVGLVKKSPSVSPSTGPSQASEGSPSVRTKENILTRSSTYDKLPSSHVQPTCPIDSEEESECEEVETTRDPVTAEEQVPEPYNPPANELETISVSPKTQDTMLDDTLTDDDSVAHCSDNNSVTTCSLDDSREENNLLVVTNNNIDSSTWRKKHQPPKEGEVSLQLPNADETCRSIGTPIIFDDDYEINTKPRTSFEFDDYDETSHGKNRTSSGSGDEKKTKSKSSVAKSIKSTFAGLFNSKTTRYQVKIEISKHSPTEPLPFTSTVSTGTSTDRQTRSVYSPKPSSGAIVAPVAPFNYSPPATSHSSMTTSTPTIITSPELSKDSSVDPSLDDPLQKKGPVISEHLTKTEMLLARRRQVYLNSVKQPDDSGVTPRGCMVTTV